MKVTNISSLHDFAPIKIHLTEAEARAIRVVLLRGYEAMRLPTAEHDEGNAFAIVKGCNAAAMLTKALIGERVVDEPRLLSCGRIPEESRKNPGSC